jgi:hypothetical protein
MQDKEVHSTASPVVKKDTMPGTAPDKREEPERKPTLSTSTQKKTQHTKKAKQKAAK